MRKRIVVGLTGGIASGKSFASRFLEGLGAYVIDTDLVAREVVAKGSPTLTHIIEQFGQQFLTAEAELDRSKLAKLVFNEPDTLTAYENIILPAIREDVKSFGECTQKGGLCVIGGAFVI